MKYYVVEPCTTSAGFEIKLNEELDLEAAKEVFSKLGEIVAESPVVVLAKVGDYTISAYGSGRLMVKSQRKMSQEDVESLAEKIVRGLKA